MDNMPDVENVYAHFQYGTVPAADDTTELPSETVPVGVVRSRVDAIEETITEARSSGPDAMVLSMAKVILERFDTLGSQDHLKGRPFSMDHSELTLSYPFGEFNAVFGKPVDVDMPHIGTPTALNVVPGERVNSMITNLENVHKGVNKK